LECSICGAHYSSGQLRYVCPKHEDDGLLNVVYDHERIKSRISPSVLSSSREFSIWRYLELLPIENPEAIPVLRVGWTPLYRASRLGSDLGLINLYLKDDGVNPTGSLKDRASAIVVAKAQELGVEVITAASSGNAGAALAGLAASAQLTSVIFVPKLAPPAKIAQLLIYGANVFLVNGTYDQAFDLSLEASKRFGWYSRNTAYNPYTTEGKKTASLEICEQLTQSQGMPVMKWEVPDRIFVSVGDGNIITGIWKGLRDLFALGWIEKMPKLMGVQAEGSAACFNAWRAGVDKIAPVDSHTIADSINVSFPHDGTRAVRAVRETQGRFLTVTDDEILDAMRKLARREAIFAEPAGATGYAGLTKAASEGIIERNEKVVAIITGNGLKDVNSVMKAAGQPEIIEPNLEALQRVRDRVTSKIRDEIRV